MLQETRLLRNHVIDVYGERLGLTPPKTGPTLNIAGTDREPRLTGASSIADHVAIDIRFCRYENAGQFRHWLSISAGGYRATMSQRPAGWHAYTLMVGRLPDGNPWWSALWDMEAVQRQAQQVEGMQDNHWYRLNPGRVFPRSDRPLTHDFIQSELEWGIETPVPEGDLGWTGFGPTGDPVPVPVYRDIQAQDPPTVTMSDPATVMARFEDGISRATREDLEQIDKILLRVRRSIRSERERRSEVASV